MGPRGVFQLIFIIVFIIAGALINATLFSELAVIVAQLNLKMTRFQEKLDIANSMCINLGLPNSLRKNVQAYLTQTEKVLYSLEEIHVFMDMLSPSLKEEVLYCTFSNLLSKNPKFVLKDHVLRFLTKRLSLDMVEVRSLFYSRVF